MRGSWRVSLWLLKTQWYVGPLRQWQELYGLDDGGGVLVRPDGTGSQAVFLPKRVQEVSVSLSVKQRKQAFRPRFAPQDFGHDDF
jgi:hypothetical protein